ncbi:allophanate hydrolase subunit 1 [Pseudoruegeria sp. HB172150]|uniref:5-oxoprolinase subunit B family protein n=1 Tax=Pseudoruegeria sp. HB172150 TaxID=2721164 RepID=UPI001556EA01|nr:allophanate hydrolase subunit 1 [Pseudoruegeria sp. HB172150]
MSDTSLPLIRDVGLTGLLVTFGERMSEEANRAALAFRAAVEAQGWDGVEETATSLTSAFLRFDPLRLEHDDLSARLSEMAAAKDWKQEPLPPGRRHWRIPVVLGGEHGPQFEEAAEAAGRSPEQATEDIAASRIRVLTIGFAPGQAYLGELPQHWNIPRLRELSPNVPEGALVAAIRQLIVFTRTTQTGWRHIGQTAFRSYRPEAETAFPLTPGDEVSFTPVPAADLPTLRDDSEGGATAEAIG